MNVKVGVEGGSALNVGKTATTVDDDVGLGSTNVGGALIMPDRNSKTSTARTATPMNASQSNRAFEDGRRVDGGRGITPVRRSLAADRGSDLAMGSAGYSRTAKQAANGAADGAPCPRS